MQNTSAQPATSYPVRTRVGADGFVRRRTVTPDNIRDGWKCNLRPLGDGTASHAVAACGVHGTRHKPARSGIADKVRRKGYRGHPSDGAEKGRNAGTAIMRAGDRRTFALRKPERAKPREP